MFIRSYFKLCNMKKKGQVTIFIIIGILLLLVVGLVFFAKDIFVREAQKYYNTPKYLELEMNSLGKEIDECITKEAVDYLDKVRYGGYLESVRTLNYDKMKIGILCQNIPDSKNCLNGMFTVQDFSSRMSLYLKDKVYSCISTSKYKNKDYSVKGLTKDNFNLNVEIGSDVVTVLVDFPIEFTKDEYNIKKEKFVKILKVPVGDVLKVVRDILEVEARGEYFDPLNFDVANLGKYEVEVKKPYPNEIYKVNLRNDDYTFWFVVEGENEL